MPKIQLKSIQFAETSFRKLKKLKIDFAERVTVIAGHNGIGKSTILALIANSSGISTSVEHKSLFNRPFQANLNEIIHLDLEKDYKARASELHPAKIEYNIGEGEKVYKSCSLTLRGKKQQIRVVPRNIPLREFISNEGFVVGRDAKIQLPTIYLGMMRILPVGEVNPHRIKPINDSELHKEDIEIIARFINEVVPGVNAGNEYITTLSIKGTRKTTKHPNYNYDSRCVSLGQDSLSSIATALASFQMLKRNFDEYPGGLLIIDEVDAGLHPSAQRRLIGALTTYANKLNLQIIMTTHSVHIVEAVHPQGGGNERKPNAVVYLMDTQNPYLIPSAELGIILNDMHLKPPAPNVPPTIKIYFEDDEAAYFFDALCRGRLQDIEERHNIKLDPMPLGVGCSNLVALSKHDPYFRTVVIAVDADASIKGPPDQTDHIVRLPGGVDDNGKGVSPERTIFTWLESLVNNFDPNIETWAYLKEKNITSDQIREHMLDTGHSLSNRESAKKWWKSVIQHITNWELVEIWSQGNSNRVEDFVSRLDQAVGVVAARTAGRSFANSAVASIDTYSNSTVTRDKTSR